MNFILIILFQLYICMKHNRCVIPENRTVDNRYASGKFQGGDVAMPPKSEFFNVYIYKKKYSPLLFLKNSPPPLDGRPLNRPLRFSFGLKL